MTRSDIAIALELRREVNMRMSYYPRRVAEKKMSEYKAAEGIMLMRQAFEDFKGACPRELNGIHLPDYTPPRQFIFNTKASAVLKCLALEMVQRRRFYSQWIAQGRLTYFNAEEQKECMQQALDRLEAFYKATIKPPTQQLSLF